MNKQNRVDDRQKNKHGQSKTKTFEKFSKRKADVKMNLKILNKAEKAVKI